jgi:hypothetical protein
MRREITLKLSWPRVRAINYECVTLNLRRRGYPELAPEGYPEFAPEGYPEVVQPVAASASDYESCAGRLP